VGASKGPELKQVDVLTLQKDIHVSPWLHASHEGIEKHAEGLSLYFLDVSAIEVAFPNAASTLKELGLAMINVATKVMKSRSWSQGYYFGSPQ